MEVGKKFVCAEIHLFVDLKQERNKTRNKIYFLFYLLNKVSCVYVPVYLKFMDTQTAGHRKQQFGMKNHFPIYILLLVS